MSRSAPLLFPVSAIPRDFGVRLARERRAAGWSQRRLADAASLKRETVVRLEGGHRMPVGDTVFRLEAALDLEPGTLVPAWPEWRPVQSTSHGARSRERRREMGLSLAEVASAASVSVATMSRFEREIGASPSLSTFSFEEGMVYIETLNSDGYAKALGFANPVEHGAFCRPVS